MDAKNRVSFFLPCYIIPVEHRKLAGGAKLITQSLLEPLIDAFLHPQRINNNTLVLVNTCLNQELFKQIKCRRKRKKIKLKE